MTKFFTGGQASRAEVYGLFLAGELGWCIRFCFCACVELPVYRGAAGVLRESACG